VVTWQINGHRQYTIEISGGGWTSVLLTYAKAAIANGR
jgi:hypothetical protein